MNGNMADIIAALTGESLFAKKTNNSYPAPESIARVAYGLYEARGRQDGHDVEDWLLAEARLANRPLAWSGNESPSIGSATEGV